MTDSSRPVALVTGASRGIGRACAVALATAGCDVAFTARTRHEGEGRDDSDVGNDTPIEGSLDRTAEEVAAAGARAMPLVADLTDFDSLEAAVRAVVEGWGRLDVLVLNAVHTGPGSMLRILDTPVETLATKLRANALAQVVLVKAALPSMLAAGGGRIIGITSYAATHTPSAAVGAGGWGYAYAASKAAFHRLAGHLAVELGDQGIVAINVDPGHVMTERMVANSQRLGLEGKYRGRLARDLVGRHGPERPDGGGPARCAGTRPARRLAIVRRACLAGCNIQAVSAVRTLSFPTRGRSRFEAHSLRRTWRRLVCCPFAELQTRADPAAAGRAAVARPRLD